tara:strand:+ start:3221 stop:3880 length:660 start_codon:yes stop_codon:yes gene_type:complete
MVQKSKLLDKGFLLAIHSSANEFGAGIINLEDKQKLPLYKIEKNTKRLSNELISFLDKLIPIHSWKSIQRIAISIGPGGGFTSTRLSIIFARTIAHQVNCPIDTASNFELIAKRFLLENKISKINNYFWIIKPNKRKGIIAGKYQLVPDEINNTEKTVLEIAKPKLFNDDLGLKPNYLANDNTIKDLKELLKIALERHLYGSDNPWHQVLPIYPYSPVN